MESTKLIRIAKISGRYLVFDPDGVALLRRKANTNGTLVGTAPQQPTQNIFLGLPIEMRPEEAEALVRQELAYIMDDVAAHRSALQSHDADAREAYIESLRKRKQAAQKVYAEMNAKRASQAASRSAQNKVAKAQSNVDESADSSHLFGSTSPDTTSPSQAENQVNSLGITPTFTSDLLSPDAYTVSEAEGGEGGPLCRFLQCAGYYMTPGLRFGAKYSIYPGDPLRFHAHFMANQYDWEEDIPILDIVGGGRLATAVKKAFLLGGEEPCMSASKKPMTRAFSIEWAGM
ncbi:putative tRNA-splicing endonuclease subunit tsp-4 [Cladobotryum mycophilum]|uniref:tRNA-splicing endonuclease subunit Sen34 n=1 Tax=Cladobotryum mycophilum TaxID=491253 RepID=A0ABR0T119_9HYPO